MQLLIIERTVTLTSTAEFMLYITTYKSVCLYVYTHLCVFVFVCMCVHVSVCLSACVHVSVCLFIATSVIHSTSEGWGYQYPSCYCMHT